MKLLGIHRDRPSLLHFNIKSILVKWIPITTNPGAVDTVGGGMVRWGTPSPYPAMKQQNGITSVPLRRRDSLIGPPERLRWPSVTGRRGVVTSPSCSALLIDHY